MRSKEWSFFFYLAHDHSLLWVGPKVVIDHKPILSITDEPFLLLLAQDITIVTKTVDASLKWTSSPLYGFWLRKKSGLQLLSFIFLVGWETPCYCVLIKKKKKKKKRTRYCVKNWDYLDLENKKDLSFLKA